MKLTVLGSGTMFPTKARLPSSFLLETEGKKILLDCGFGALARMTELGHDPRILDAVFISHFHTDHMGDLFPLIHARFVGDMYEGKNHTELEIFAPHPMRDNFKKWRTICWPEPKEDYPLKWSEGPGKYFLSEMDQGVLLELFPVCHVEWFNSVGLRLEAEGKILVYPGDIGSMHSFDDIAARCVGADLLIIEAGYEKSTPNHWTLEQTRELMDRAKIKKSLLVHVRAKEWETERINSFIKNHPDMVLAKDRMVIEI